MRLIDADDLKKTWYKEHNIEPGEMGAMFVGNNEVPTFIDRARTIEPVRHGRWIEDNPHCNGLAPNWNCSMCGGDGDNDYNYCPNCGAKMDGDADD